MSDVDLAKIDPCPECGTPVRRFASTPIAGSGLDAVPSGPWWCPSCLRATCVTAAAGIEHRRPTVDVDRLTEATSQPAQEALL